MLSRGYTFVELLIALALGSIVMTIAAAASATLIRDDLLLERKNTLLEVSQLLASRLSREIRRSGYISRSGQAHLNSVNPFQAQWQISGHPDESANSCVLLAYDKNHDGTVSTADPNELTGFRLHDETIEQRADGRHCDQGWWQDITDPRLIRITYFKITYHAASPSYILLDMVLEHADSPSLSLTRTLTIALPNH